jgi:hypothetical protein
MCKRFGDDAMMLQCVEACQMACMRMQPAPCALEVIESLGAGFAALPPGFRMSTPPTAYT